MGRKRIQEKMQDDKYLLVARRLQENLRVLRDYHDFTYAQLSEKTGYSKNYLVDIFSRGVGSAGNKAPSLDLLVKLADIFQTSPGKLLEAELEIKTTIERKLINKLTDGLH
jgi:transcriptional regulator with XRE-family HTH domain